MVKHLLNHRLRVWEVRGCRSGVDSTNDPDRAAQRHLVSVLVWRERGADRFGRCNPLRCRLTIERPARWSHANRQLDRAIEAMALREIEGQIDRLGCNCAKSRAF